MSAENTVELPKTAKKWLLVSRPVGEFKKENFKQVEEPLDSNLADGEIFCRVIYISVDPTLRNWVHENPPYTPRVELGSSMPAYGIAEIIESKMEGYLKGEMVVGFVRFQEYCKLNAQTVMSKVHNRPKFPLHVTLNAFGVTGMTAYWGVLQKGEPKEGQTFLVSGAAGATGMAAGCFAKIKGMRVVGIAGTDSKCEYITQTLGFDAAINYKTQNVNDEIKKLCPKGVDVYYDNVGGKTLDTVLQHINHGARIVVCGAISSGYTETGEESYDGIKNYTNIIFKEASMRGVFYNDHSDHESLTAAAKDIHEWMEAEKFPVLPVSITKGIDSALDCLIGQWKGDNLGKALIEVVPPPAPYHS